jgi:hypothetical protein
VAAHERRLRQPAHRESRHERIGELPLQPRDLLPERPAGRALVGGDAGLERCARGAGVLYVRGKQRSSHSYRAPYHPETVHRKGRGRRVTRGA